MGLMKQPGSQLPLPIGHEVPRGAKLLSIASGYEDLPDAIPCGLPACHAKHKRGFVVEFLAEDGKPGQGMVGHICGSNHFGAVNWKRQMTEHRARERVAGLKSQVEALILDCELLLPQIEPLVSLADIIDKSRHALQTDAKDLYRVCDHASRRDGGLISYEIHSGKTIELRLRHRGFWTRTEVLPRLKRLLQDLRGFPSLARDAASVDRLNGLITALGFPFERAREIAAELSEGLQALDAEHMAEIVPIVNGLTDRGALRMKGGWLEVCSDYYPSSYSRWTMVLDLGLYPQLAEPLSLVRQAISARREAA